MKRTRQAARAVLAAAFAVPATIAGAASAFLLAATIGAVVPAEPNAFAHGPPVREIVILEGLLHTDILLPATADVRAALAFAGADGVPISATGLRWISVGRGSEAFYTTTGRYRDIRLSTVWKAATGDASVLRIVGFGPLQDGPGLRRITISEEGFARLLGFVRLTFDRQDGRPVSLDASLQPGDAFYRAEGRFHLLRPCNEWTRAALNTAGIRTGAWTPTTFSLAWSLDRFAAD